MTRPRFRICPEGLDGWYVEQMYLEYYTVKVGFPFWSRTETREWTRWKKVYYTGYRDAGTGNFYRTNVGDPPSPYATRHELIPWPRDKDEIKKILDKEIKKYDDAKSYDDLVKERLRNTPPEEYP